jgi:hypothetical protein
MKNSLRQKILVVVCLLSPLTSVEASWRWSNLDPFNRNSALRNIGRRMDPFEAIKNVADTLALKAKDEGMNEEDCTIMVAAGITAFLAKVGFAGGPWGASLGAAAGVSGGFHTARLACRNIFS